MRRVQSCLNKLLLFQIGDKPHAALKFKSELLKRIKEIPFMPYKNRKSIFFVASNRKAIFILVLFIPVTECFYRQVLTRAKLNLGQTAFMA